jgi:hypothetical protein
MNDLWLTTTAHIAYCHCIYQVSDMDDCHGALTVTARTRDIWLTVTARTRDIWLTVTARMTSQRR